MYAPGQGHLPALNEGSGVTRRHYHITPWHADEVPPLSGGTFPFQVARRAARVGTVDGWNGFEGDGLPPGARTPVLGEKPGGGAIRRRPPGTLAPTGGRPEPRREEVAG
jgi:hypothetical protein